MEYLDLTSTTKEHIIYSVHWITNRWTLTITVTCI